MQQKFRPSTNIKNNYLHSNIIFLQVGVNGDLPVSQHYGIHRTRS